MAGLLFTYILFDIAYSNYVNLDTRNLSWPVAFLCESFLLCKELAEKECIVRVCPRLFDQVGHQTINTSSGNKYFFNKWCYHQTYQNYEQS